MSRPPLPAQTMRLIQPQTQTQTQTIPPFQSQLTTSPPPPVVRTVSDAPRCSLHRFLQLLGVEEAAATSADARDSDDPEVFDAYLLEHPACEYAVARALFLWQNRCGFRDLRLWHLVQSRAATTVFLRLVQWVRDGERATDSAALTSSIEWLRAQCTLEPFDQDAHAFSVPIDPPVKPTPPLETVLRWCQQALPDGAKLTREWLDQSLAELALEFGSRRMMTKRHARVQVVRLLLLRHHLRHHKQHRHLRLVEKECVAWLRAFELHGCACIS